jgi:hypothetical protein
MKHRHSSLQPIQQPKIHERPSDIPSKEQWRSSLKSAQTSTSSRSSTGALSDTFSSSSPRQAKSSPTLTLPPVTRSSPSAIPQQTSDSFTSVLSQTHLSKLQQHLNNIHTEQLTHYSSTWSYDQTLDQFLRPDHFYLKDVDMVHRSYLSSSTRSHIYSLAHTISTSQYENKTQRESSVFALAIFLLRLVMFFGVDILIDAPAQCEDPTGLRVVESTYQLAREVAMFLKQGGDLV